MLLKRGVSGNPFGACVRRPCKPERGEKREEEWSGMGEKEKERKKALTGFSDEGASL